MGAFADFADLVHGPEADWGQVSCGCHPNCGVGTAVMIDKKTKDFAPVPQFLSIPGLVRDMQSITDAARGKTFSNLMMGLALLKNYRPFEAPPRLKLWSILEKFDKSFGLTGKKYGEGKDRREDNWNFLFVAGMWFQDLFNYDFRRTEMCIIPYATRRAKSLSVPITLDTAGETSLSTCTRMQPFQNGTRNTADMRSSPAARM